MFVLKFWKTQGWKLFHPGEDVKVMESLQTAKNHCSFQFLLSVLSFPLGMPLLPFQPRPGQQQLQEKRRGERAGESPRQRPLVADQRPGLSPELGQLLRSGRDQRGGGSSVSPSVRWECTFQPRLFSHLPPCIAVDRDPPGPGLGLVRLWVPCGQDCGFFLTNAGLKVRVGGF